MINQNQIKNIVSETIASLKLANGRLNDISYCIETDTYYRYIKEGSAYTPDNIRILTTNIGGDTRWVSIAGKYILDTNNVPAVSILPNTTDTIIDITDKLSMNGILYNLVIKNGTTDLRVSDINIITNGTDIEYTEMSTLDIGDTSNITFKVNISGDNIRLLADNNSLTKTFTIKGNKKSI